MRAMMNTINSFQLNPRLKKACYFLAAVGIAIFFAGLYLDPKRSWINLLVNNFYFTSLALGALVFLAIQNISKAAWSRPMARVAESISSFLPVAFGLTIIGFFGIHSLYEWSHADVVKMDPILLGKSAYLNVTFFIVRVLLFFAAWMGLQRGMTYFSRKQDRTGEVQLSSKLLGMSIAFMIVFALSYSFFSFDMIMSLEPHWFSTIFGIYTFSGLFVNILSVLTLLLIVMQEMGYLKFEINENHYHDLGKLIFGFSTFWAYIWFSQYLLIWYSNIPEETTYYYLRTHHTWDWPFYANLIINWVVPFFALMSRDAKRRKFVLSRVCVVLIIGHWLDLYLMVAPPVFHHANVTEVSIGWIEIGMAVGFGAIFILLLERVLGKNNIVAIKDPYLEEGLYFEQ